MSDLVTAYVSRAALRHNLRVIRARAGGTPVCAVVKANAYGHGLEIVVRALAGREIACWGVATPAEALGLRQAGARAPALVFRPLERYAPAGALRAEVDLLLRLGARATVVSRAGLELLAAGAARRRRPAGFHLKVDTGMGRNGCAPAAVLDLVCRARALPGLRLEGLYSHLACADEADLSSARRQLAVFNALRRELTARGLCPPVCHLANSGGIFNLPGSRLDLVRPGVALYGYGGPFIRGSRRLRPALRVEAPVIMTKWLRRGEACGYGAAFVARRPTRCGLLPIGYADGYVRAWSAVGGQVDFGGQLAPLIGRLSMDLAAVDLTDLPGVDVGRRACLISNRRRDPHSVESMAARLGTIPYEITTGLGNRVQRVAAP